MNVHVIRPRPVTDRDEARAGQELGHPIAELYQAFVWERGAALFPEHDGLKKRLASAQ
jgi:hypothetical protein